MKSGEKKEAMKIRHCINKPRRLYYPIFISLSTVAVVMCLLCSPVLAAIEDEEDQATDTPSISWYNMSSEVSSQWRIVPDPYDELRFYLESKDTTLQKKNKKRIIVLFPKKSSAYDIGLNRILRVFYSKRVPAIFMAINFNGDEEAGKKALEHARNQKFDLLISMGSSSTSFVHNNFRNEKIPVVSSLSKDPVLLGQMANYEDGSKTNMAYTSVAVPLEIQIVYLKELKPELKNIGVLYGEKNKSAIKRNCTYLFLIYDINHNFFEL